MVDIIKKIVETDSNAIVLDHNMATMTSQLQTSNSYPHTVVKALLDCGVSIMSTALYK